MIDQAYVFMKTLTNVSIADDADGCDRKVSDASRADVEAG
jgi:hypothetical protein